eukprot:scaffold29.g5954.t1
MRAPLRPPATAIRRSGAARAAPLLRQLGAAARAADDAAARERAAQADAAAAREQALALRRGGDATQVAILAERLEKASRELRMVRLEAASAARELAAERAEKQELASVLGAALDAAGGDGAGMRAGASPLPALAATLRDRVVALVRGGGGGGDGARGAELAARDADIARLREQLGAVRAEAAEVAAVRARVEKLEREAAASAKELRTLWAMQATADRHLDCYERMVVKLESKMERLQAEKQAALANGTASGASFSGTAGAARAWVPL